MLGATLGSTAGQLACAGMRQLDAEYRLDKNIKIAMLYLEDDDAVSAEAFIKKASALIGSCKARAPKTTLHPAIPSHFIGSSRSRAIILLICIRSAIVGMQLKLSSLGDS